LVVVLLCFCDICNYFARLGLIPVSGSMDQSAEVAPAEVVSAIESDSSEMMSFGRLHGHAVPHNTPCRHFAGRLSSTRSFVLITHAHAALL